MSATDVAALPATAAELAVVGRSNVGKSSLLNALGNRKALAHVSKTPGRTRLLNLYEIERSSGTLVDLPGYGYAAVSAQTRATWPRMIETYLLTREHLEMVVVCVDGEIGPTKIDLQTLEWIRDHALPHTIVATKHDKVRPSQRPRRKNELAAACRLEPGDVVWTSASKGTGIDELRAMVATWLS